VTFVPELPKTRNLKIMRRVIRAAWLGLDPGDLSSLVNPESVEAIRQARKRGQTLSGSDPFFDDRRPSVN